MKISKRARIDRAKERLKVNIERLKADKVTFLKEDPGNKPDIFDRRIAKAEQELKNIESK
jgi:hypothetical protein